MLAKRSWRLRQTSSSRAYPPSIYVIRRGGPAAPIAHLDTSGAGTVFLRNFTLSAQLGGFNADGGVLVASDGATLSVAAAGRSEEIARGGCRNATLNSGWVVRPAARR